MSDIALYVLVNGSIYVIITLGLTLSYGVQGILDIANPAFMVLGAYFLLQLTRWGLDPLIALPIVLATLFLLGALTHRGLISPLHGRPPMETALVLFGLLFVIQSLIVQIWSANFERISLPYLVGSVNLFGRRLESVRFVAPAAAVVVLILFVAIMRMTSAGRTVRGTYSNRDAAELSGISTRRVDVIVYGCSTAAAGVAAFVTSVTYAFSPSTIIPWFLIAFTVVIMGGRGSLIGPPVAAILLAFAEAVTAKYLPFIWVGLVSVVVFILVLIVRPTGLFGRPS